MLIKSLSILFDVFKGSLSVCITTQLALFNQFSITFFTATFFDLFNIFRTILYLFYLTLFRHG
jgi:hypothetical protein